MSLPYRVSDAISFLVLEAGVDAQPLMPGGDKYERALDVLLRADPSNNKRAGTDEGLPDDAIIYIGDAAAQRFPLRPNESVNLRVTRRNAIWFRAGARDEDGNEVMGYTPELPLLLHVVTALLNVGGVTD